MSKALCAQPAYKIHGPVHLWRSAWFRGTQYKTLCQQGDDGCTSVPLGPDQRPEHLSMEWAASLSLWCCLKGAHVTPWGGG
jgi:hypothetical protein